MKTGVFSLQESGFLLAQNNCLHVIAKQETLLAKFILKRYELASDAVAGKLSLFVGDNCLIHSEISTCLWVNLPIDKCLKC